jgi:hypothetical protein
MDGRTKTRQLHLLYVGVLAYALLLGRLLGGDLLNSYPFVTDDGFDWVYQGHALYERAAGLSAPALYVLRDPVFVFVSAVDAALQAQGAAIIFALAISFLATGVVLLSAASFYRVPVLVSGCIVLIILFTPLNFFRLWVLADPVAVAISTASAFAMVHYLRRRSRRSLAGAAVLAVVGGMTQTYAAIPFFVGIFVAALASARSREHRLETAVAFVTVGACLVVLKLAWIAALPHEIRPTTFALLRPSFAMARFYANVWTLSFGPLLPLVVGAVYSWYRGGRHFPAEILFLSGTVFAFAFLSFIYQHPEARFTFLYLPIVLLLLTALASPGPAGSAHHHEARRRAAASAGSVLSLVLILLQLGITPRDQWEPKVRTAAWRPAQSWVGQAWFAQPQDRFGLGAPGVEGAFSRATLPRGMTPYAARIVDDYFALRRRQEGRREHDRTNGR